MEETILRDKTLLVVDDETDLRDIVASELEFMGGKVFQAENISVAKSILSQHKIDLIVSDIRMPGGTGIDLLDSVKSQDVNLPPIVLITGFADITQEEAFHKGAEALMNKPFKLDDLIQVASRYTSPVEKRFSDAEITATKELAETFSHSFREDDCLAVGRGGMSICFSPKGRKFDIGESLRFSVKFSDLTLSGVGICRWAKINESMEGRQALGIEFVNLEKETLNFLLNHINSQDNLKPFIPSIS